MVKWIEDRVLEIASVEWKDHATAQQLLGDYRSWCMVHGYPIAYRVNLWQELQASGYESYGDPHHRMRYYRVAIGDRQDGGPARDVAQAALSPGNVRSWLDARCDRVPDVTQSLRAARIDFEAWYGAAHGGVVAQCPVISFGRLLEGEGLHIIARGKDAWHVPGEPPHAVIAGLRLHPSESVPVSET